MNIDPIYQEVILDHYKNPRNCKDIEGISEKGHNASCGDKVEVIAKIEGDKIEDLSVCTKGCAICTASGSIMSEKVKGMNVKEVEEFIEKVKKYLKGELPEDEFKDIFELQALSGVRKLPVRIKCALLPWITLENTLKQNK
ncbi:conserved hypothetical protein [Thermotomaculum hydrothermale]|uniref:NIF system FeS cluster assembly NifU N-terminal domain-containing protein n=1 Tax=Thermotomaculum hydrothermale TaxID=981385 RepID=A0A7R6PH62_9BACT|nr:SUF system NifU family Fe-S cluster assembly protein [Thermotomaculum hydrothermale]BBB33634.1 conserved hypothetical protein [Thermotomaculum hydrothermale]